MQVQRRVRLRANAVNTSERPGTGDMQRRCAAVASKYTGQAIEYDRIHRASDKQ